MYERFTKRAREVMQFANKEAQRLLHEYIGTEHILLGLTNLDSGVAVSALRNLGIEPRRIRREIEKIIQSGPSLNYLGDLPRMPRAKNVIGYAIEESRNLKHNCIGTEHLLLGLLREQEGVAAQVLLGLGLRLDTAPAEIENVLAQPNDWGRQEFSTLPPLRPVEQRARQSSRCRKRVRSAAIPTSFAYCGVPSVCLTQIWKISGLERPSSASLPRWRDHRGFAYAVLPAGRKFISLRCKITSGNVPKRKR